MNTYPLCIEAHYEDGVILKWRYAGYPVGTPANVVDADAMDEAQKRRPGIRVTMCYGWACHEETDSEIGYPE
jgi:hypothetical protein